MKIINGCKYWGQLLLLPIYWLSFLMPRDKNIWLFGSTFGRRFADNPRYLYLYVSQHSDRSSNQVHQQVEAWKKQGHQWNVDENCKNLRPIWMSHNRDIVSFLQEQGYEAYYYHSLKGIWYALRGGVYVYDNYSKDINFWQSGGAVKVNLWHGLPLKKIQHDNIHDRFRHPRNVWEKFKCFPRNLSDEKPSDTVLCPSERMRDIFASAFQTEHVIVSGYPRWDGMLEKEMSPLYLPRELQHLTRIAEYRNHHPHTKMLCYMPTFRQSEKKLLGLIDFPELERFLQENDYLLCIKLHPKSTIKDSIRQIKSERILVYEDGLDSNLLLKETDVLVTDYSSAFFDFALTEKPIVFFCYDYEEYVKESRELYFDYEEVIPGAKVETQSELQIILKEMGKTYSKERNEKLVNSIYKKGKPNDTGKEVVSKIYSILQ